MSADINSLKAATRTVFREITKHANGLATGLQNAAPPEDRGPGKSILYLTEIAAELETLNQALNGSSSANSFHED